MFKNILKLLGLEVYTMTLDSFKQQFGNMMDLPWKTVKVKNQHNIVSTYETFPLDTITVINDQGKLVTLKMKPSLQLRVTDRLGNSTTFYLDKIKVKQNTLSGGQSRYLTTIQKDVRLSEISKIQIQDTKRKYSYV